MRIILPLALLMAIPGCAGPIEQHLVSTGPGVSAGATYMWAGMGDDVPVGATQLAAREALARALAVKGYVVQEEAPLVLAVGLSERDASIAVEDGTHRAVSQAKSRRLFQNCADRILRMSVHATDRTTGAERFSGSVQEAHCHAGVDEVLPRLSLILVEKMAAPGGVQLRSVSGRD